MTLAPEDMGQADTKAEAAAKAYVLSNNHFKEIPLEKRFRKELYKIVTLLRACS